MELCSKVSPSARYNTLKRLRWIEKILIINICPCFQIQGGAHPVVSDLHAVRSLFSGPPLGIRRMGADQMVSPLNQSNSQEQWTMLESFIIGYYTEVLF